ncbi:hypothetical protein NKR23_g6762 [Pleurostoma richardsiae]|uniref:Uncharacterized protein n=1 Tax=Pleurostoma richardsiae TaxID=41990 RepID=A0AA38VDV7_9PEZI|nr:hypothetical protein NKR23_g6762 [Pleurostoma richardsiae]
MCLGNVRSHCLFVADLLRRRKEKKRVLEISAPFNFQKVDLNLPGISDDEISVLREKAIASRIGIAVAVEAPRTRSRTPRGRRAATPSSVRTRTPPPRQVRSPDSPLYDESVLAF